MASALPITLNDGRSIPQLGLGVRQMTDDEATAAVSHALEARYRHVDIATIHHNEMGVGRAIATSSLLRDKIFVTTELWNKDQGRDLARPGLGQSLEKLGLDHTDLYLIHWPCPTRGIYTETQEQLINFRSEGLVHSTGVCNFLFEHFDTIVDETGIAPVVDQIELHPTSQPDDLTNHCSDSRIITESWSPLGQAVNLEHPAIARVAERFGVTPVQVIIRWHLDRGSIVIPESKAFARIESNFATLEMRLPAEDRAAVDALSAGNRIGPDPATLETVRPGTQLAEAPPANEPSCTRHVEEKRFNVIW